MTSKEHREEFVDSPIVLDAVEMERHQFVDEDGTHRTFAEELKRRIDANETFPQFFASTEY